LIRADDLEERLFAFILKSSPDELLKQVDRETTKAVTRLEAEQVKISKDITRLIKLSDLDVDEVRKELEQLKKRRADIQRELEIKKSQVHSPRAVANSVTDLARLLTNDEREIDLTPAGGHFKTGIPLHG